MRKFLISLGFNFLIFLLLATLVQATVTSTDIVTIHECDPSDNVNWILLTSETSISNNTETYKHGTGALNVWKSGTTYDYFGVQYNLSSAEDWKDRGIVIWVYIKNEEVLNKIKQFLVYLSNGSTEAYWNLTDELCVGWCHPRFRVRYPDGGDTDFTSIKYIKLYFQTNSTSDTLSEGDLIIDYLHRSSSYAAINKITVTGEVTWDDLVAWDKENAVGWVDEIDDDTYLVWAHFYVGDGSTPTSWKMSSCRVIIAPKLCEGEYGCYYFRVDDYANVTVGEVLDEATKTTCCGCHFSDYNGGTTQGYFAEYGGNIEIYSSSFWDIRDNWIVVTWNKGAKVWNCWGIDNIRISPRYSDIFNVRLQGAYDAIRGPENTIDRLEAFDCSMISYATVNMTLWNVYARRVSYVARVFYNSTTVIYINPDIQTTSGDWIISWAAGYYNRSVWQKYTFDLKVTDKYGNPIEGASVRLYDKFGDLVFEATTDANGEIPQQIVTYRKFESADDTVDTTNSIITVYTPHKLVINHRDYPIKEYTLDVDKPISLTLALGDKPDSPGYMNVYGTEYEAGESGVIYAQVFYGNGTPANSASCNVTIYSPTSTLVSNEPMTYISGSNGIYYYTFTAPSDTGVFVVDVKCSNPLAYGSAEFHVSTWSEKISSILSKIDNEIIPKLNEINQTVHENYDLAKEINQTTHQTYDYLVSKWGSITAQQLYDLEQSTNQIADYINSTRWSSYVFKDVMDKWSSYTASDLYSISEQAKIIADYINSTRWNNYLASDLYSISNQAYLVAKYINETRWDTYTASDLYSISQEIKTLSTEINQTTHQTYDYLQEKWGTLTAQDLYDLESQTNQTANQILEKWGSYTAEMLYNKIEDAYLIADYINKTRWGSYVFADVMNRWGSYTASDLYAVSNDAKAIASYINSTRWGSYLASDLYSISEQAKNLADYINSTRWGSYTASDLYSISQEIKTLADKINETTILTKDYVLRTLKRLDDYLIIYLRFDEGSGTITYDFSGYNNDGTLKDYNTTNEDGNTPPLWDKGIFLEALHFDGVDDYVEIPYSQSLDFANLTQLTVSFWVKSFIPDGSSRVLIYRMTNKGFEVEQTSTGKVRFILRSPTYGDTYIDSTQTITDQEWHHIVATWNGEEQCIYIDGVLQNCVTRTSQIEEPGSSFPLVIGGHTYWYVAKFSNFTIDELRIYKRGLTGDEVKALYLMSKFAHEFSYLSQINETTQTILTKINDEIIPKLEDINRTVYENYNYLSEINQTTHETYSYLVSKWGSITAQQLYDLESQTKSIADYINKTRWGSYVFKDVMDKWGTYTASSLYSVSDQARIIADYINKTRWGIYFAKDLYSISKQAKDIADYINSTRWYNLTANDLYAISDRIKILAEEINETTHEINLTTGTIEEVKEIVEKIWNITQPTNQSIILEEEIISSTVSSDSGIIIRYKIKVPGKEGYSVGDWILLRLRFWFVNNTECVNQGSTENINLTCTPIEATFVGRVGDTIEKIVEIKPANLEIGKIYKIIREIAVDPTRTWIVYGREPIGYVKAIEKTDIYVSVRDVKEGFNYLFLLPLIAIPIGIFVRKLFK